MQKLTKHYVNGKWVAPIGGHIIEVVSPASEKPIAEISLGNAQDVDRAVSAAKVAFESFSLTSRQERVELLDAIAAKYRERWSDIAEAMTAEMGAPATLSATLQAEMGAAHFETARDVLKTYEFERTTEMSLIRKEPIGVCGFITPWNWPMNQIGCKAGPAIATGCSFVWKPSELSPLSAHILTEIFDAAGVPPGVVNMIHGDGLTVGAKIASHTDIKMVSFTGSTRAGEAVAIAAAPGIKRVSQELGGKSANIILDDLSGDKLEEAVATGIGILTMNSGQNCNAPSRMLAPRAKLDLVIGAAKRAAEAIKLGDPSDPDTQMGPVITERQWGLIQGHIDTAIAEGVKLVTGGPGRPDGLETGYYVKPTIFVADDNSASIAQNEVFGPVLVIIPYDDDAEAVQIANDSEYGLSGYVFGEDLARINTIASKMRTGMVHVNGIAGDMHAPFGGYKKSGNGREWGEFGFDEFLETKAVIGFRGA